MSRGARTVRPVRTLAAAWLILSALLVSVPANRLFADDVPLVIGRITISTNDIYAEDEDAGLLGTAANGLHLETRESVVRELLLFREGDPFDPERLAETERNLRELPFLRTASVTASEPRDGRVDVVVVTQDSWSTEPGLSFGSKGGGSTFGFDFKERNLMGRGWEVQYEYEHDPDRTTETVSLRDPSFFGPYWQAEALYASNSDGSEQSVRLERPFVSTQSRWSMLLSGVRLDQEERLYQGGLDVSTYAASHDRFDLGYGWTLRNTSRSAHRLSSGFSLQSDAFEAIAGWDSAAELPHDRDFRYLWGQYDYTRSDYRQLTWVNRSELPEDFNLGAELSLRIGISPTMLGAPATTGMIAAHVSKGFALGERSILLGNLGYESRIGASNRDALLSAELEQIIRYESAHPQSTILAVRIDQGWELDRDHQLFADGESGLRGYRLHAFEGDQRLIVNAEHRVYLGRELFHFLSPGMVAFVDGGMVDSDRIQQAEMKFDAGIGLLLGLSRSGHNTIRIDLAHAFSPDPLGRSPWVISVSGNRSF